jgi:hypothetical protein
VVGFTTGSRREVLGKKENLLQDIIIITTTTMMVGTTILSLMSYIVKHFLRF